MMKHFHNFSKKAALFAAALFAMSSIALAADDPHIRGKVTSVNGDVVTIETAAEQAVEVSMAKDYTLFVYTSLSFEDLKTDNYIGVPSVPAPGGGKRALAVVVFPDAMKGFNEGDGDWDLVPGSRMTNASLAKLEGTASDRKITVSYKGDTETIEVPENAPVVTFAPDKERRLVVGDNAILFAKVEGDKLSAGLAGISKDGTLPPI